MQTLTDRAGDLFRHVALVAGDDVIEVGRTGYRTRDLKTFAAAYTEVAVGTLDTRFDGRRKALLDRARAELATQTCAYLDNRALFVAGILSLARARRRSGALIGCARWGATRYLNARPSANNEMICSTFIVRLFDECLDNELASISLRSSKRSTANYSSTGPDLIARHFAMPDDIWRSPLIGNRTWLRSNTVSMAASSSRNSLVPA